MPLNARCYWWGKYWRGCSARDEKTLNKKQQKNGYVKNPKIWKTEGWEKPKKKKKQGWEKPKKIHSTNKFQLLFKTCLILGVYSATDEKPP